MNRIVRDVRRPFRAWNRRYRALGAEARKTAPSTPQEMFLYCGVTKLLAVAVGLTINYLVMAFAP